MSIQDRDYMHSRGGRPPLGAAGWPRTRVRRSLKDWIVGGVLLGLVVALLGMLAIPMWRLFGPRDWSVPVAQTQDPERQESQEREGALDRLRANVLPQRQSGKFSLPEVSLPSIRPSQPFPSNGDVITYQDLAGGKRATFSVDARGAGLTHYVIKLEEWNTRRPVLMTFVTGGAVIKLEVPLGIYRVKMASGESWYGMEEMFGPGTNVQEGDKPMQFYESGNTITGHTLILAMGSGDRFPTSRAVRKDF